MTVKELIEKLHDLPPDMGIGMVDSEHGYRTIGELKEEEEIEFDFKINGYKKHIVVIVY